MTVLPALLSPVRNSPLASWLPFLLLCVMTLCAPVFFWPTAQDAFVLPKEVFLTILLLLLSAAVVGASAYDQRLRIALHPITGLLAMWVLWQGLSLFWSVSPTLTLDELWRSLKLLLFAVLFQSLLTNHRQRLLLLGWLVVGSACVVAVWALALDAAAAFGTGVTVRVTLGDWRDVIGVASLGNSGHVADWLAQGFLVALALALTTWNRRTFWLLAAALWVLAAGLIVAWSVHSNGSLILGVAVFLLLLRGRWNWAWWRANRQRVVALAAGWALVVAFFVLDHPANPHGSAVWNKDGAAETGLLSGGIFGQAFSSGRWQDGGSSRLAIWLTTLEIVRTAPFFGTGAGTFTWIYPATKSELLAADPELSLYASTWANAAHNDALQAWGETGIVGVFLLVAVIGAAFWFIIQRLREESYGNQVVLAAGAGMLAAWCGGAMMSFPLELPVSSFLLMALVSIPVVLPPRGAVRDLLLPVERHFPILRLGAVMKNLQVPVELTFRLVLPRAGALGLIVALAVVAGLAAWLATARLRASVLYHPVYEGLRVPLPLAPRAAGLEAQARRVLDLDPGTADARSALTDLLVRTEQFEKAIPELEELKKRLNSVEVHVRHAVALEAEGRVEEARSSWNEVFSRRPDLGSQFPGPFRRWVQESGAAAPRPQT